MRLLRIGLMLNPARNSSIRLDCAADSLPFGSAGVLGAGGAADANGFLAKSIPVPTAVQMRPVTLRLPFGAGPFPSRGAFQRFIASIVCLARLRLWRIRYCVW